MEHESPAKRQRSSPCERVCLVFHGVTLNNDADEFQFYIVDWDSSSGGGSGSGSGGGGDECTDMEPTIRFKVEGTCPPLVTFCALKSTLYMFEGDDHKVSRRGDIEGWCAGKFAISEDIVNTYGCYNLEKQKLARINKMNQTKFSPKALPTPNGKSILVFSSKITWFDEEYFGDSFELYNVEDESWQVLPRLPPHPRFVSNYLTIKAYGFENESRFLIRIATGVFVLDLNKPSAWEQLEQGHNWIFRCLDYDRILDGHFLGIDGFYFSPGWTLDTRYHGRRFKFPPLSSSPLDYASIPGHLRYFWRLSLFSPYISLLGQKNDCVYDIGTMQAQCHPDHIGDAKNLHVVLDISRTDIDKFKRDSGEWEKYERAVMEYEDKKRRKLHKSLLGEDGEPGQEYDDEDEGEAPRPVFTNHTLRNIPNFIKSFQLRIDFDFNTYYRGEMFLFSI